MKTYKLQLLALDGLITFLDDVIAHKKVLPDAWLINTISHGPKYYSNYQVFTEIDFKEEIK